MNEFKVIVQPGREYHFKMSLRAFDPAAKIASESTYLLCSTVIDLKELQGFTSVKSAVDLAPKSQEVSIEEPWTLERIRKTLNDMVINGLITTRADIVSKDLDSVYKSVNACVVSDINSWNVKYPRVSPVPGNYSIECSFLILNVVYDHSKQQCFFEYRSSLPVSKVDKMYRQ